MDMMNQLKDLFQESEKKLPFRNDRIQKMLDLKVIPQMAYAEGEDFILRCIQYREEYICGLFNTYYDTMNPIYYRDEPKHFVKEDFRMGRKKVSEGQWLLYIGLPLGVEIARDFCRAYVLTFVQEEDRIDSIRFYEIWDSLYEWRRLNLITETGESIMIKGSDGNLNEDLKHIAEHAFGIYE